MLYIAGMVCENEHFLFGVICDVRPDEDAGSWMAYFLGDAYALNVRLHHIDIHHPCRHCGAGGNGNIRIEIRPLADSAVGSIDAQTLRG